MNANILIIAVIVAGVILFIAAAAVAYSMMRRSRGGEQKFDERQTLARFKAYRAAFWTLVAYLTLNALYASVSGQKWGDAIVEPLTGICAAFTVFVVLCVFSDAYFALNENRRLYLILFAVIAIANGALVILNAASGDGFITDGALNFHVMNIVVLAMFVILFIALAIKALIARREAKE